MGKGVAMVEALLERGLLLLVVVVAVAGLAARSPGAALVAHGGINAVLAVLVLFSVLSVPGRALTSLSHLWPRLVLVLAATTVVLPVVALGVGYLVGPVGLRHGVLAVGVAPAEVASIGITGIAEGDVAAAAALLVASVVIGVVVGGPILSLLAGVTVSSGHVVGTLALVVGLPLVIGLVGRRLAETSPLRGRLANVVAMVAVLALVYLVASQAHLSLAYLSAAGALLVLIAVSAGLGRLFGRLFPADAARAVLLHVSMRDFAVASGIAAAAFGPRSTGPLALYGVLVITWGAVVARWRAGS